MIVYLEHKYVSKQDIFKNSVMQHNKFVKINKIEIFKLYNQSFYRLECAIKNTLFNYVYQYYLYCATKQNKS